jgi:tetratricopeptide (TPR) repeat protein
MVAIENDQSDLGLADLVAWQRSEAVTTPAIMSFLEIMGAARATLLRIAAILLIAGFAEAIGFGCSASARDSLAHPELSPDRAQAVNSACMPRPSGPAYQDWVKGALKYNEAIKAQQQRENDIAALKFDAAIKLYPRNALAYVGRAQVYEGQGNRDRALEEYNQALKFAPTCFVAFNSRCYSRAIVGDLQAALADCNEALRLYQGSAGTLDSRGFVYLKMGDLDKAIADYDAALKIDPDHARSLFGRGKARIMKGDEVGGEVDIIKAQHIQPDVAEEMARYGIK